MQYSDKILNEIRIKNDIVEVASEYIALHKKGKDLFGLCPFCKGKNQNFSIVPSKQIFYCFACGKGGNIFHFIRQLKSLSFDEAVKFLADKSGINLDEQDADAKLTKLKDKASEINKVAGKYFYTQLISQQASKIQKFLSGKELSAQIIKKFGIGYSLNNWDSLYKFLLSKGYHDEDIELTGLVFRSNKGNLIDRFRNRVMFPLFDGGGYLTGFSGLALDNFQAKYLYTPDSNVFNRKNTPFGFNIARSSSSKQIIFLEDNFDVLLANQYGINCAVAIPHYYVDNTNIRLLKGIYEEIIIAYSIHSLSSDDIFTKLKTLVEYGYKVRIFEIPDGKTMQDIIQSKNKMTGNFLEEGSKPLLDYIIDKFIKSKDQDKTDFNALTVANGIINILAKYGNEIDCEVNVLIYSTKYNISYESFMSELNKRKKELNKRSHD